MMKIDINASVSDYDIYDDTLVQSYDLLPITSDVTLQLYTTNVGQGLPAQFSSTNFASVVIAKLS